MLIVANTQFFCYSHLMKSIDVFKQIQKIISVSLKIDVQRFEYPYLSIHESDKGFRQMLWGNFDYLRGNEDGSLAMMPSNHINLIKSNLKFTNLLYRFPKHISDDILLIGPFIEEEVDNRFLQEVITSNHLTSHVLQLIDTYYHSLPLLDDETVLSTLQALLPIFLESEELPVVQFFDFSSHTLPTSSPEQEHMQKYRLKSIEKSLLLERELFGHIIDGNQLAAKESLRLYIQATNLVGSNRMTELRRQMIIFNTQCMCAMANDKVHPYYINQQFQHLNSVIEAETRMEYLRNLPYLIVRKYCLLSTNYSFSYYSQDIRKAINYIDINLDSPISLKDISDYLGKNASTFSSKFKRETGQTVTEFIRESKIKEAIRLLNITDYAINDIGAAVGIHDFSYFCKIFKASTGMTPSAYKNITK